MALGIKLMLALVWGEPKVKGVGEGCVVWAPGWKVSVELKSNGLDRGQTRPLVGFGLFEEKMPLWNLP